MAEMATAPGSRDLESLYPPHLTLKHVQIVHRHGARTPAREFPFRWLPKGAFDASCSLAPQLHARLLAREMLDAGMVAGTQADPNAGAGDAPGVVHDPPTAASSPTSATPVTSDAFPFHERPLTIHSFSRPSPTPSAEHGPDFYRASHAFRDLSAALSRPGGPCNIGQLVDAGKRHLESIGGMLRERYVRGGLLPPRLDRGGEGTVHVRSTDFARTVESAQYLVSGLYPAEARGEGLELPVHVGPMAEEFIFNPPGTCPRLTHLYALFRSQLAALARPSLSALEARFPQYLPQNAIIIPGNREEYVAHRDRATHHDLYDANACLLGDGSGTLDGVDRGEVKEIGRTLAGVWYGAFGHTPEITRLSMGRLVDRIAGRMEAAAGMSPAGGMAEGEKMVVWSGHDATVAPLMIALEAWDGHWPDFGANMIFELLHDTSSSKPPTSSHYVRVLHNLDPIILPGCARKNTKDGSLCELGAFLEMVEGVRMGDGEWKAACAVKDGEGYVTDRVKAGPSALARRPSGSI